MLAEGSMPGSSQGSPHPVIFPKWKGKPLRSSSKPLEAAAVETQTEGQGSEVSGCFPLIHPDHSGPGKTLVIGESSSLCRKIYFHSFSFILEHLKIGLSSELKPVKWVKP